MKVAFERLLFFCKKIQFYYFVSEICVIFARNIVEKIANYNLNIKYNTIY